MFTPLLDVENNFNPNFEFYLSGESPVCVPVVITYSSSVTTLGGLMYSFDVYDIGPIKSTEVFNVPKPCL